jgi:hypothetical protein
MSLETGDDGKVLIGGTPLADIAAWSLETTTRSVAYASSATGGFRKRLPGVKEGRGRIQFKLDVTSPITNSINEGSAVTLLLYLDATRFYTVPAVIESLQVEVAIDGGQLIGGQAEFSTDGAWTKPTYS